MDQYWYLVIINESTVVLCPTAFMNPDLSAAAALTSTSLEHHHCIYGARVRVLLLELGEDRGVLNHSSQFLKGDFHNFTVFKIQFHNSQ